jgi:hypothetical protein
MISAEATSCPASRARAICESWVNALNTGRLADVLALYAEDAVLLPTFSPRVLRTAERRREYFERLSAQPGLNVSLHENTLRVQNVGTLEICSGIYLFRMEIDEAMLSFEARFSYVIDPQAAHPILHHHSSQIPRNLT